MLRRDGAESGEGKSIYLDTGADYQIHSDLNDAWGHHDLVVFVDSKTMKI